MASLLILTALLLNACSKDGGGSGGNVGPMDVTRYSIEGVSDEATLTETDYRSRLAAIKVKPRSCRQSNFGVLRKGDRFVINKRGSSNIAGTSRTADITANVQVNKIGNRDALYLGTIENVTGMGLAQNQIIKSNRTSMLCRAGKECIPQLDYISMDVKRMFETYNNSTVTCQLKNFRNVNSKYGAGNYVFQDGRKVSALVDRSQTTVDVDCTGQATQTATLSLVTVYSNQAKSFEGDECTNGVGQVYRYALVQSEASRTTLMEFNTRLLSAPAR